VTLLTGLFYTYEACGTVPTTATSGLHLLIGQLMNLVAILTWPHVGLPTEATWLMIILSGTSMVAVARTGASCLPAYWGSGEVGGSPLNITGGISLNVTQS
jgi:hypothetical protein